MLHALDFRVPGGLAQKLRLTSCAKVLRKKRHFETILFFVRLGSEMAEEQHVIEF